MKLILQSDDVDIRASAIRHAEEVSWFQQRFDLKLLSTSGNFSSFLRDAGVKRMRFTKAEEKALGEFIRGELYTDGIFQYYFVIFSKGAALLACEEATTSCIIGYLQFVGLSERQFENDRVLYLKLLGYRTDETNYILQDAGLEPSLKALHGKLRHVHKYTLGDDQLFVAWFKSTTVVQFGGEDQLLRVYSDLGIVFSADRLERHIIKLLGSAQHGRLRVKLVNGGNCYISQKAQPS